MTNEERKKGVEKGCGVAGCGCVVMMVGAVLPLLFLAAILAGV